MLMINTVIRLEGFIHVHLYQVKPHQTNPIPTQMTIVCTQNKVSGNRGEPGHVAHLFVVLEMKQEKGNAPRYMKIV